MEVTKSSASHRNPNDPMQFLEVVVVAAIVGLGCWSVVTQVLHGVRREAEIVDPSSIGTSADVYGLQ